MCLSAMNKMCFGVKKCIRNAFSSDLETRISKKIPLGALLTQQKIRKLNLWEKTAVEKSAWIKACLLYPWKSSRPLSSPLAGSWDQRGALSPRWWFLMVWGKSAHLCLYFQLVLGKRNIFYSAGSITNWWAAAITLLLFIYFIYSLFKVDKFAIKTDIILYTNKNSYVLITKIKTC